MERNYPLRLLTTWKIGGPGEYVYWPEDWRQVVNLWRSAKEEGMPLWLIGRGSNLLIGDEGLPGITVVTTALRRIVWDNYSVRVEAGYPLAQLAQEAAERSLSGLEFARGIPGTVGGAIVMNAGAHGADISARIQSIKAIWQDGEVLMLNRPELHFAYRDSSLKGKAWVLEAELLLEPGDKDRILSLMKDNLAKRKENQPLDLPNAGSVFRNPPGDSAGRLIEAAGWKGKRVGGAEVSTKHANFIVNKGNATAKDVLTLIEMVQKDIKEKFGIELVPEIHILAPRG